jgi:membrane protease YdiL (CAAX protease family)
MISAPETTQAKVNWRQVGLFLGLTFAFTYVLDLLLQLAGGLRSPSAIVFLQLQMLLPAFFAIFLGMFVFPDSAFYVRNPMPDGRRDRARGFFYLYMALTLFFVVLAAISALAPTQQILVGQLRLLPLFVGLLGLILFRVLKGREAFARANLRGGRLLEWIVYGAAIVAFLGLQTALNAVFHLGKAVDLNRLTPPGSPITGSTLVIGAAFQTIVVGSLLGLVIAFGEEYGWRVFLQGQLIRLGNKRGVLLVGLIWGAWHYPIIWMGFNYPGHPVVGTLLMTILCILLAYVFGYAMLRTGSIWLVAFMHAIFDQTANFFAAVINTPTDPIFSFGIGLPGLAMLAAVVLLLLRDPVWKDTLVDTSFPTPATVRGS